MADGSVFSARATNYYDHLMTLGQLIDEGDAAIGLPPYNGGLFNDAAAPLLANVRLPDAAFASIIYDLSHTETPRDGASSTIEICRFSSWGPSMSVCWSGSRFGTTMATSSHVQTAMPARIAAASSLLRNWSI